MSEDIPSRVKPLNERSTTDLFCAILFILSLLTFLGLGFVIVGSSSDGYETNDSGSFVGLSGDINDEYRSCCEDTSYDGTYCYFYSSDDSSRRLATNFPNDGTLWDAFTLQPQVPSVLFIMIIVVTISWIYILQRFPRMCMYSTIGICIAFLLYFALIIPINVGAIFIIIAILFFAYFFCNRNKIDKAAMFLSQACLSIQENPSLFLVALVFQILAAGYLGLLIVFFIESASVLTVENDNGYCRLKRPKWVENALVFLVIQFFWGYHTLQQMKLIPISGVVANWYFIEKLDVDFLPWALMKLALTKSSGTAAFSGIVVPIVSAIYRQFRKPWYTIFYNPIVIFYWIIGCLIRTCLKTFTSFSIIIHTISGRNFLSSAKIAIEIIFNCFHTALIAEFLTVLILSLGAYLFSMGIGISCWAWYEDIYDWNVLSKGDALTFFLLLLMFYFNRIPFVSLFFVILLAPFVDNEYAGFWAGTFFAVISHIFLQYMAGLILDCMNTVFMCYAIDKRNGKTSGHKELIEVIVAIPIENIKIESNTKANEMQTITPVASPENNA